MNINAINNFMTALTRTGRKSRKQRNHWLVSSDFNKMCIEQTNRMCILLNAVVTWSLRVEITSNIRNDQRFG